MSEITPAIIEAEEIPIEQAVEKNLLTELEKLEITKQFLQEKRDECLELKLNGQDKEAYAIIRETRLNMKTRRVAIEKICKKKREDATRTQKAWIAVEKDWTKIVSEGEDYLQKLEDEFEAEAERIKAEAKRKMEETFILRQADLTKMGAFYLDGSFVMNDISYEAVLVKEADEDLWEGTIKKAFHLQYLSNEDTRLLEEKRKMDEDAERRRQQADLERKQEDMAKREAALQKAEEDRKQQEDADKLLKQKEAQEKKDAKINARCSQLQALGLLFDFSDNHYKGYDCFVPTLDISFHSDEKWDELIEKITPHISRIKEEEAQKKLDDIERQKQIAAEDAAKKERERFAEEQRLAEIKKQQEEEKRVEELAQASDRDKWSDFLSQLNKLSIPEMRSGQYRKRIAIAKEKLEEIIES